MSFRSKKNKKKFIISDWEIVDDKVRVWVEQWAKDKLQREQSQKRQISHSKDSDLSL